MRQRQGLSRAVALFRLDRSAGVKAVRGADEIDFDALVLAQKQWSKTLRRLMEGRSEARDPAIVSREYKCAVGAWLYGAGKHVAVDPAHVQLRAMHAQFHQCAGDLLRYALAGARERAEQLLLGCFADLSPQTMEEIRNLECKFQAQDAPRPDNSPEPTAPISSGVSAPRRDLRQSVRPVAKAG